MATINTTCPVCGAPHARKLSLIHAGGITTTAGSIHTVGKLNTIGRHTITTNGTTSGVQQTEASRSAAPPVVAGISTSGSSKKSTILWIGVLIIVIGVFLLAPFVVILGVVIAALAALVSTDPTNQERKDHAARTKTQREAYERWEKTFECGSCGERFVP